MLTQLINKKIPIGELVLQNALVFLVEAYLKLVLDNSYKISHCEVDFHNICVELHKVSMEIEITLEQEIIELVRLNATESVGVQVLVPLELVLGPRV